MAVELAEVEEARLRRQALLGEQVADRERHYGQLRSMLGITPLNVAGDGNCFYASLLRMFGPRLAKIFGGVPTIEDMRNNLADAIQADFNLANADDHAGPVEDVVRYAQWFPGTTAGPPDRRLAAQATVIGNIRPNPDPAGEQPWDSDAGDRVAEVAALLWRLPITLLGQRYPVNIGPPEDREGVQYVIYTGDHYMGSETPERWPVG